MIILARRVCSTSSSSGPRRARRRHRRSDFRCRPPARPPVRAARCCSPCEGAVVVRSRGLPTPCCFARDAVAAVQAAGQYRCTMRASLKGTNRASATARMPRNGGVFFFSGPCQPGAGSPWGNGSGNARRKTPTFHMPNLGRFRHPLPWGRARARSPTAHASHRKWLPNTPVARALRDTRTGTFTLL